MIITDVLSYDLRFPTSKFADGSDAVHKDPDYSCVYVVLKTSNPNLEGYGYTFTLGRGNEVVLACVKSLSAFVIGKDFERDILTNMVGEGGFYYQLTQESQMRWIGPEKGVIALACGAILNAVWDLWARQKEVPLWQMIVDMKPEELIELIDFKHITDFITKEEGLKLLKNMEKGKSDRVSKMQRIGAPVYTTSAGWLGYPEDKMRALCREYLGDGYRYFKMKVGSKNFAEDVNRARVIREEIDKYPNTYLMMDANQKWDVDEAIANMEKLAQFNPLWIEEPTNCDDIIGHAKIARALEKINKNVGVATGEACHSKVMFKQLLQQNAIRYCQVDSCRLSGLSELLAVLLMAAKNKVKVCPHAGGIGLCEYVRHIAVIDYCVFNDEESFDRVVESTTHLHEHFIDPVVYRTIGSRKYYVSPLASGYAKMKEQSIADFEYPNGKEWKIVENPKKKSCCQKNKKNSNKKCNWSYCDLGLIVGSFAFGYAAYTILVTQKK